MNVLQLELSASSINQPVIQEFEYRENPVYFCKNCHRCWERARNYEGKPTKSETHYYNTDIVPTYGKERKSCPECEKSDA